MSRDFCLRNVGHKWKKHNLIFASSRPHKVKPMFSWSLFCPFRNVASFRGKKRKQPDRADTWPQSSFSVWRDSGLTNRWFKRRIYSFPSQRETERERKQQLQCLYTALRTLFFFVESGVSFFCTVALPVGIGYRRTVLRSHVKEKRRRGALSRVACCPF